MSSSEPTVLSVDINGDQVVDVTTAVLDSDGDGVDDVITLDANGDHRFEVAIIGDELYVDTDGDGDADSPVSFAETPFDTVDPDPTIAPFDGDGDVDAQADCDMCAE